MTCGEHHGYGSAMGMGGDVSLRKSKRVHSGSNSIGGCDQTCIEAGNTVRLAHVEEIEGEDA